MCRGEAGPIAHRDQAEHDCKSCGRHSPGEHGIDCRQCSLEQLRKRPTCSVDAAATILGIGRSTAYAAARDGSLPTVRISHRLLVPTSKLLALLGHNSRLD